MHDTLSLLKVARARDDLARIIPCVELVVELFGQQLVVSARRRRLLLQNRWEALITILVAGILRFDLLRHRLKHGLSARRKIAVHNRIVNHCHALHRGHACLDTELFEHVKVYLLYYIIDWTLHRDLGGRNVRLVEFVVHASFLKGKHVSVALIPLIFVKNSIVAVA